MKQYLVTFVTKKGGEEDHEMLTMANNAKEAIANVSELWYSENTMHAFRMHAVRCKNIPDTEELVPEQPESSEPEQSYYEPDFERIKDLLNMKRTQFKVIAREESIDCHGLSFLCIYGKHINGGFVAITNWGVAAELSVHINDLAYNRSKLLEALERSSEVSWLPSDEEARSAVARDLAMMIGERISEIEAETAETTPEQQPEAPVAEQSEDVSESETAEIEEAVENTIETNYYSVLVGRKAEISAKAYTIEEAYETAKNLVQEHKKDATIFFDIVYKPTPLTNSGYSTGMRSHYVDTVKYNVIKPDTTEQPETEDTAPEVPAPVEKPVSEVKECTNCPECIYYEKCTSNASERMQCKSKYPCVSLSCCADFQSRKSIDDIYEEQKTTEQPYKPNTEFVEICVNCRSCFHFCKCLDSGSVVLCNMESDSPFHLVACETDSNIECVGKYLDCYQTKFEYIDSDDFILDDDELPF